MQQILEDYKIYYQTRYCRYESNSLFQQSYKSEKDLYNCIASVQTMDELMQQKAAQFRELSLQNGIALVKDQANYQLQFYTKEKETIKAKGQQEIIAKINTADDAITITTIVNDIQVKNDREVLIDNLWPTYFFTDVIGWLERIEVVNNAIVPDEWKADMQKQHMNVKNVFRESLNTFLSAIRNYEPTWQWNFDILWEHRHRKKCPLPDAVFQQRINECKTFIEKGNSLSQL